MELPNTTDLFVLVQMFNYQHNKKKDHIFLLLHFGVPNFSLSVRKIAKLSTY